MPFNKKGDKILIPIRVRDPDNGESIISHFCYVPYPTAAARKINRLKRKLAKQYGFSNAHEFWEEISDLAHAEGYESAWRFINDGSIDEYYEKEDVVKKKKKIKQSKVVANPDYDKLTTGTLDLQKSNVVLSNSELNVVTI